MHYRIINGKDVSSVNEEEFKSRLFDFVRSNARVTFETVREDFDCITIVVVS